MVATSSPNEPSSPAENRSGLRDFVLAASVLTLAFIVPLAQWVRFSLGSDLFSHLILVPAISGYLIWHRRNSLPPLHRGAVPAAASVLMTLGILGVATYWLLVGSGNRLTLQDSLALLIASYFALLVGLAGWLLSADFLKKATFPLAFLVFAAPFPVDFVDGLETFLQHGSAEVVSWMFPLAGTPVYRDGLIFQLPGITLKVAQECSGIHSTVALFITSILAGHFFLQRPGTRLLLVAAVIPLALVRNGFRVFVIGELCVHISPDMIHSIIHRQGGPIFFALSLIPFTLLLYLLRRWETRARSGGQPPSSRSPGSP